MKKLLLAATLAVSLLAGCSEEKFESYEKADEYLMKAVHTGDLEWDNFQSEIAAEDHNVSENEFQALKDISATYLEDGTVEIKREDNATMIYNKGESMPAVVVSWTFEDDTFKVDDIIMSKN